MSPAEKASEIIFGDDTVNLKGVLRRGHLEERYFSFWNYRRKADRLPLVDFATICKLRRLSDEEIVEAVKAFY